MAKLYYRNFSAKQQINLYTKSLFSQMIDISKKMIRVQSLNSANLFTISMRLSDTLKKAREEIKKQGLTEFTYLRKDKTPVVNQAQPQVIIESIINEGNIIFINQLKQPMTTDIDEQIKFNTKLKIFQQFQQKIQDLKQRLQSMNTEFGAKIHGLPKIDIHYQGEMSQFGLYEGIGRYVYENGEVFIGEFKDGNRHGLGCYTFLSGDRYQGEYKNGWANGLGREIFTSGESMAAVYKNNNSNGIGIFYYPNGEKLMGQFVQNNFHGQGYTVFPDGTWLPVKYNQGFLEQNP